MHLLRRACGRAAGGRRGRGRPGTVWAWGRNGSGQLGVATSTDPTSPVQVGSLGNVPAVAGGLYHSLAVKADGTAWGWGYNRYGQLATGTFDGTSALVQVVGPGGTGTFAGATATQGSSTQPFVFTGEPRDSETELVYLRRHSTTRTSVPNSLGHPGGVSTIIGYHQCVRLRRVSGG